MDSRIDQLIAVARLRDDIGAAATAREAQALARTRKREPRPAGRRFVRQSSTRPIR
jgi:hypothetical protein